VAAASRTPAVAGPARVIFLGPPGAGKGTQAARLAEHLGVPRVSTGDMLREAIAEGTAVGEEAAPLMDEGHLVPDGLLITLIRERIGRDDCARGFVLDGFPRTVPQAEGLAEMDRGGGTGWTVLEIDVPRDELLRRLSGRRWCPRCQATYHLVNKPPRKDAVCDRDGIALVQREDDKEEVVAQRLREYDELTAPLIDYYRARGNVIVVDGFRPVAEVFADLRGAVEVRA
jgi:adenylate kinase